MSDSGVSDIIELEIMKLSIWFLASAILWTMFAIDLDSDESRKILVLKDRDFINESELSVVESLIELFELDYTRIEKVSELEKIWDKYSYKNTTLIISGFISNNIDIYKALEFETFITKSFQDYTEYCFTHHSCVENLRNPNYLNQYPLVFISPYVKGTEGYNLSSYYCTDSMIEFSFCTVINHPYNAITKIG